MDEELSEKNIFNFLKSNSRFFIYTGIIFVLIIVVFFWFIDKSKKQKIKISEDFIEAKILLSKNNETESKRILEKIIEKNNSIYGSLSLFLLIDEGLDEDKQVILNYFDKIISNNIYSEEDKNLLRLKKAIYIADIDKEQDMIELLNPIINSESVWKIQALKFLGDLYYSKNQFEKANQYYSLLLKEDTSESLKSDINRKINSIKNE
tara:strand:+ start:608 stop:1228 length:621 start_codon:yes stop_codon:yes gene_type:complete